MASISLLRQIFIVFCLVVSLVTHAEAVVPVTDECDPQAAIVQRVHDLAGNDPKLICRAYNQYRIGTITAESTADVEFIAGESILVNGQLQVKNGATFVLNVKLIPWGINDTGAAKCTGADEQMIDCPVAGFPDQDALFGRDLWFFEPMDGHAGFSYTKLDENGNSLPADAQHWRCIHDNVTNLIWEKKSKDGGLQDWENTYSWYNPDDTVNAGFEGTADAGICTDGIDCDTLAYVEKINSLKLCGSSSWSVPTRQELLSIVRNGDLGGKLTGPNYMPAFESTYFPNTNYNQSSPGDDRLGSYWSATPFTGGTPSAFYVNFGNGETWYGDMSGGSDGKGLSYLRLVHQGIQ